MEAQSTFGEWLRARRKALDLTQFDLAERVGCAEDTIGRIEAGTRRPSRQVAALLAEALSVPAQSHDDFVRFAREGGPSVQATLIEASPGTGDSVAPAQSAQPTRAHPSAWVPYLSSLPQPPTPLIGRADEVATAVGLLGSGKARLLTLTGPPGVGKTRLALAVAAALIPAFPDGICFVPLAPLRDPDLLALTITHALGLSDNAQGLQATRLLDFLRHKRLLLVLDNFEQILDAGPQIAEWLSASAHVQVLATSRSALRLRGERLFPVTTLPLPPVRFSKPDAGVDLPSVARYPSVALFVERAQAVDPSFELTGSNSKVVTELVRRMEGLPLAIELTAARSARLAPESVLARLKRRLDIVPSSTRGVPADLPHHQRTLRAAIEWSYDLLGEPECLLFERMSVFVGGATLDALEAICNAREDLEGGLDDALEGLLQQSLVHRVDMEELQANGEADIQAGRRFNMLEMLREYAGERLALREKEGDEKDGRDDAGSPGRYHAEYYLAMAEAADLQKWTAEQERWLERLERDHGNLRAAIQWAIDSGEVEMAAAICGALWNFWKVRGYLSEGRSWLDKVLVYDAKISPLILAGTLNGAGALARAQGDYAASASLLERSLAIYRELGNVQGMADCLNNFGTAMIYLRDYERAEELYEESLELWRTLDDPVGISRPLHNLAMLAQLRRDNVRAERLFRESLELSRVNGDKDGTCVGLYNLGAILMTLAGPGTRSVGGAAGDECLVEAERCFTESIELARSLGDKSRLALCFTKLGELSLERGGESALAEATTLIEDGLALHRELGDRAAIAFTLTDLGYAALLGGDPVSARSDFEESLDVSRALKSKGHIALGLFGLAVTLGAAALASSSQERAARDARRAVQLYAASEAQHSPVLPQVVWSYYRITMDTLRGMLPEGEVEDLQALGQEMSLDETIAFALATG